MLPSVQLSNIPQTTSECGKNKNVTHEPLGDCVNDVLTQEPITYLILTSSVMLLDRRNGNMQSVRFAQ